MKVTFIVFHRHSRRAAHFADEVLVVLTVVVPAEPTDVAFVVPTDAVPAARFVSELVARFDVVAFAEPTDVALVALSYAATPSLRAVIPILRESSTLNYQTISANSAFLFPNCYGLRLVRHVSPTVGLLLFRPMRFHVCGFRLILHPHAKRC
ncbi:MAG: hypothetical protein EOP06_09135 [Proteobacteria bacterium]|nr:MAG: hypothetical protein EOP06_09135 [Pseudomonadota bacterium]